MTEQFDVVVLGQGLAGTALTWQLRSVGVNVLGIDRESSVTASKVAAGLVTPITGQKLAASWRHSDFWPAALAFYRTVERETDQRFFRELAMVRLFENESDRSLFESRCQDPDFARLVDQPVPLVHDEWFVNDHGGFQMPSAGQLDVQRYLSISRDTFLRNGAYRAADVDVSRDIELCGDRVILAPLGIAARRIVFCQGIDAVSNPWFREVVFKPAKGEVLTVRIPGLSEHRVIHRGVWLMPIGDEIFKVGATYEWHDLSEGPTPNAREELISQLRRFVKLPFEVIAQQAAVRPIHRNQFPVAGIHPQFPQLGYFNGLGSKGALQAPLVARQLADLLTGRGMIDPDFDLNLKTQWDGIEAGSNTVIGFRSMIECHVKLAKGLPLTQQAQDLISQVLRPGDTAIDATAGNGHDTHFLAKCVGASGTVISVDIQQAAIDVTRKRLTAAGLQNVRLLNDDHSRLAELIPRELHGQITAIMFNLGFLPGGDKQIKTTTDRTRQAVLQATELLRPEGLLTILAYSGHDGGASETESIAQLLEGVPAERFEHATIESRPGRTPGPRLFVVRRKQ